jgi:hypothetical protein
MHFLSRFGIQTESRVASSCATVAASTVSLSGSRKSGWDHRTLDAVRRRSRPFSCFHRHEPGWPEPLPTIAAFLDDVPARQRAAAAILEVKARYTLWEADVFGEKGAELK